MAKREEELLDYSDTEEAAPAAEQGGEENAANGEESQPAKGSYVGVHSTGFKDFLLKGELLRAIQDCGFEHPSEVQQHTIPQAILGVDVICQAKSGLGKTAVFVLSTLQQLTPVKGESQVLVVCHTRELAYQIKNEFDRFSKYLPDLTTAVVYGGTDWKADKKRLTENVPNIVVGTPGRLCLLIREKALRLNNIKTFVIDECDRVLDRTEMRADVQDIFRATPQRKQVMMFSATMSPEIRQVCRKFMQKPLELYVDDDTKLTLHGLHQYYAKLEEKEKTRKLNELLDNLEFNQVIIFVKTPRRAEELNRLLNDSSFPSIAVHGRMRQENRIENYREFKEFNKRICVATDLFGRGIDIERINLAINYDMPTNADQYLHRVGRAGRFGTKGLGISFVSTEQDQQVLDEIQGRFQVKIEPYPEEGVDPSTYLNS